MARKKKNKDKQNYKELTESELLNQFEKAQADLKALRFRSATAPLNNPMEIRVLRREAARLLTFLNQRRQQA